MTESTMLLRPNPPGAPCSNGQSTTVVVFLIGEVLRLVLQLSGLLRLRNRTR